MIRRHGNFGFVDNGAGEKYSFNLGARSGGWAPSSFMIRGGASDFGYKYIIVNVSPILPYGLDNYMPGHVCRLVE